MFAAAFLSKFFIELSPAAKISIAAAIVSSIVIGAIITPDKEGDMNE